MEVCGTLVYGCYLLIYTVYWCNFSTSVVAYQKLNLQFEEIYTQAMKLWLALAIFTKIKIILLTYLAMLQPISNSLSCYRLKLPAVQLTVAAGFVSCYWYFKLILRMTFLYCLHDVTVYHLWFSSACLGFKLMISIYIRCTVSYLKNCVKDIHKLSMYTNRTFEQGTHGGYFMYITYNSGYCLTKIQYLFNYKTGFYNSL